MTKESKINKELGNKENLEIRLLILKRVLFTPAFGFVERLIKKCKVEDYIFENKFLFNDEVITCLVYN